MLFVLRQLRRLEIQQRSARYFLYALGEIVLIVVGILIAVQIQTWNENRNLRAYEISVLNQFSSALERDLYIIDRFSAPDLELKEAAVKRFLTLAEDGALLSPEDFDTQGGPDLNEDLSFGFTVGPFDDLKSSGFDRISNPNLRREIIGAYSGFFPDHAHLFDEVDLEHNPRIEGVFFEIFEERLVSEGGEVRATYVPRIDPMLNNPAFLRYLTSQALKAERKRELLDRVVGHMNRLKDQIDAEIKSLEAE